MDKKNGGVLLREGRRHSIWGIGHLRTQVPRHSEIVDILARKICPEDALHKDLKIPFGRK